MAHHDYKAIYSVPLARLQNGSEKLLKENLQEASVMLKGVEKRIQDAMRGRDEVEAKLSRVGGSRVLRHLTRNSKIDQWNDMGLDFLVEITQLQEIKEEILATLYLPIEPANNAKFQELLNTFEQLRRCERVWDVTSISGATHFKSSANQTISRVQIALGYLSIDQAHPSYKGLHIPNSNGPDIVLYPYHALIYNSSSDFVVMFLKSIKMTYSNTRFHEDEKVPSDSIQSGLTWTYVNRDGSPDRRFAINPRIPVLQYGEIDIQSPQGLWERIQVSNSTCASAFVSAFNSYASCL